MSQSRLVDEQYYFLYDPTIYKYSQSFFYTISGTPTTYNGNLRFNDAKVTTLGQYMYGDFEFKLILPSLPAASQSKIWGLYSRAYGTRNAAYFYISGTNLYTQTYNDVSDVPEQTTIATDLTDWGGENPLNMPFEIRWRVDRVEFWIGDGLLKRMIAKHTEKIPKAIPLPLYISNDNSDILRVDRIAIRNVRKFETFPFEYITASNAPSESSSQSPSSSASPSSSSSPSLSPSSSKSPSNSPSKSPSSSLSPSSSISPSNSPSKSPSSSLSPSSSNSPSKSPSLSPSSSNSPSVSPSYAPTTQP